ncbi:hypothetical protein E2320_002927 [Naja naja]|nr:hypothetical protein E2320_002927 [Naja naja]
MNLNNSLLYFYYKIVKADSTNIDKMQGLLLMTQEEIHHGCTLYCFFELSSRVSEHYILLRNGNL